MNVIDLPWQPATRRKIISNWTAATTLQRLAEIIEQETEQNPLENREWAKEQSLDDVIALFERRIVRDAMPSGARHELTKPTKPKRLPTESLDVGG